MSEGFKIASAYVDVTANADNVASDVEGSVGKSKSVFARIGGSVGGQIIAGIGAMKIGSAIVGFISDGISYASDLNESMSKVDVLFGNASASIHEWSKTTSSSMGISQAAAEDAAGSFGNIFTQMGIGGDAAAEMSKQWIQMAADQGSFNNLDTQEVIDMQSAALRGEYDSLKRIYPNINANRVAQEAMNATGKTSVDQLTAQEKAQALQTLMLKDGEAATGDFARTSDGYANKQKIVAAQTAELAGKFGALLLPVISKLQSMMLNYLIPAVSSLITFFQKWGPIIGIAGIAIAAYAAYTNAAAIATGIMSGVTKVATAAQWLMNAALTANPIGLVVAAIAALVAGLIYFFTQTETGQKAWESMTSALGTAWDWLWNTILKPYIDAFIALWTFLWENVIRPIVDFIVAYVQMMGDAVTWLWKNAFKPAIDAIVNAAVWLKDQWMKNCNLIKDILSGAGDFIQSNFQKVIDFFESAPGKIGGFFSGIGDSIKGAFKGAFNGVANMWNNSVGKLSFTIPDIIGVPHRGEKFNFPKIPGLYKGGTVTRPGDVLVGERGPEILSLNRGASVTPLDRAGSSGAGASVGGVTIQQVVIDAKNVDEFQKVVDVFSNLGRTARSGVVVA